MEAAHDDGAALIRGDPEEIRRVMAELRVAAVAGLEGEMIGNYLFPVRHFYFQSTPHIPRVGPIWVDAFQLFRSFWEALKSDVRTPSSCSLANG